MAKYKITIEEQGKEPIQHKADCVFCVCGAETAEQIYRVWKCDAPADYTYLILRKTAEFAKDRTEAFIVKAVQLIAQTAKEPFVYEDEDGEDDEKIVKE